MAEGVPVAKKGRVLRHHGFNNLFLKRPVAALSGSNEILDALEAMFTDGRGKSIFDKVPLPCPGSAHSRTAPAKSSP